MATAGAGAPAGPAEGNGNGNGGTDDARRRRRRRGPRPATAGPSLGHPVAEPEAVKPIGELLETILEKLGVPRPDVADIRARRVSTSKCAAPTSPT